MRMSLSLLIAVAATLGAGAADFVVARKGKAAAVIVQPQTATAAERHAASELASFLEQVTGAPFAVAAKAPKGSPRILVGPDAARLVLPEFSIKDLGTDGIVLQTVGNDLVIAGGRPRGTLYAAYTFLEDYAGCRWWAPGASTVPRKPDLRVPRLTRRYVPQMEYRLVFWYSGFDEDWAVRNRTHGKIHPPMSEKRGGSFLVNNFCHTFFFLIPPKKYFEAHPEWFSLINGQRVPDKQLCLTNDAMRQEMVRNLQADLKQRPDIKHLWVSQNDWGGPCQCANCAAVDREEGSASGSMLRFVNAVAAEIEKDYPEAKVCTLAYQYTRRPPRLTKPRQNVVVWLCDIECNFAQPLDHQSNLWWYAGLEDWGNIAPNLYFWEYTTNFWSFQTPHPNWFTLGPNVRLMAKHGVKGVFAQGAGKGRAEMAELRAWVLAKLLWDPSVDDKALIQEFLDGYYGPAGKHLRAYLDGMTEEARNKNFYASYKYTPGGRHTYGPLANVDARCLSLPALTKAWRHLAAAEAAVANDAVHRQRVSAAQAPLMALFLSRWDELRRAATDLKAAWPMPNTKAELEQSYREALSAKAR